MADSKRRILLIALGTTPHLLTFTLAALYKESPEAMPTEIRIVTTELGAEMARRSFFGEGNILDAFWRDYGLSPAAFTEADIHAISSADGEPIADIRTLDDSNRAADLIVKLVRECCEDPDASLHVSIVGGRKSMGMLMGSALTFYGRNRDRISHTLSENETAPDRRPYPSPEELAANPDVVILADLPFLRLRQILPAMMLSKEYSFSEIVRNSQQAIEYMPRVRLTHDGSRWRLYADGVPVHLEPKLLGLYAWLLLRTKLGRETPVSYGMLPSEVFLHLRLQFVRVLGLILTETRRGTACRSHLGVEEHVLEQAVRSLQTEGIESDAEFYRAFKAATGAGGDARSAEVHKAFVNAERSFSKNVSELRSKCNDKIRAELADQIPDVTGRRFNSYLVESNGQKDATAYGLQISPENIELPQILLDLCKPVETGAVHRWREV